MRPVRLGTNRVRRVEFLLTISATAVAIAGCGGGSGTPPNAAPSANAGDDRIVDEGTAVVLAGDGADRDGAVQSYRWTQVSGPSVVLDDAAAAETEFTSPDYAEGQSELVFWLTVTDDDGATGIDDVTVTVNALPTAAAGADQDVDGEQRVRLTGRGEDRDGSIESYALEQLSGARVVLDDADTAEVEFTAPAYAEGQAELLFRLTVTDNRGATATDEVTVSVNPPAPQADDPFARWNDLEPESWWRPSAPYTCAQTANPSSPWLAAGLMDLGGSDPLSLIRYFGNGSYLRFGNMGFWGCTPLLKYPDSYRLDPPADPTYYSLGELDIHVDIARVPANAAGWLDDDGERVEFSMERAVSLLNTYVAFYFRRVSGDRLRITFHAGHDFAVPGDGSPSAMQNRQFRLLRACLDECEHGAPGGLNRILLHDVAADTAGEAYNGWARLGLASLRDENMETVVHEMGHGWMAWPHSFTEVGWRGDPDDEVGPPNPYSNFYDIMSALDLTPILGWDLWMPSPLAINRYAAGWIHPEDVALHVTEEATYILSEPGETGHQFLVIHSGRRYAFTTVEVLEDRAPKFTVERWDVYDPVNETGRRSRRYHGVLVSRYDQTGGTGINARFGPALYDRSNPDYLTDVGWGRDDYSLLGDGQSREIGGGVKVSVQSPGRGSWAVTVSGGRLAAFDRWCDPIWFSGAEYDTGCFLDEAEWE